MSVQFAKLLIVNLEKRKQRMLESKTNTGDIIYMMLSEEIDAIKETILEMGHKL